jgi:hypothetical protein
MQRDRRQDLAGKGATLLVFVMAARPVLARVLEFPEETHMVEPHDEGAHAALTGAPDTDGPSVLPPSRRESVPGWPTKARISRMPLHVAGAQGDRAIRSVVTGSTRCWH